MLSGGDEGSKEEERKVYSRKNSIKGLKTGKNSSNLLIEPPEVQGMMSEGLTSTKKVVSLGFDAGSDNFSGLNRDGVGGKGGFLRQETRVRINLSMKSKQESRELKKKLEGERDLVRSMMRRIEANEGLKNTRGSETVAGDKVGVGMGVPRMSKPLNQLSVSVLENSKGGNENVDKEKRTPKANQLYRNSDFLLAKDKFPSHEGNRKLKSNGKKGSGNELTPKLGVEKFPNQIRKSCNVLLERLMKHKHGWVFNKPVDVVALGLHDYFEIIKHPMDLGTVKKRLTENWYKSAMEFAEDVRLTFRNAMTYNPKGQDVYAMAEQLSKLFEEKWAPIEEDYKRQLALDFDVLLPTPKPAPAPTPTPTPRKPAPQPPMRPKSKKPLDRSESMTSPVEPKQKPPSIGQSGRVPLPKKPKAKDPNKREMTFEEKQKLSINLQSLPSEKLETVVQIIKKRNTSLQQQDDEIEVDIDCVDTETLWELDRFITYYKKSLSMNKRKAAIVGELTSGQEQSSQEKILLASVMENLKGSKKDVEKVASSPIQVEEPKENDKTQGESHSGSSDDSVSSSSRDFDGESSSEDGSDGEHSPNN